MSEEGQNELVGRIKAIQAVEVKIGDLLKHANTCILELSKEKQISKGKMEDASMQFKKTLTAVETELSQQMQYLAHVCVGSAHQGSTFASQQNIALAEHAEKKLHERMKEINELHFQGDH